MVSLLCGSSRVSSSCMIRRSSCGTLSNWMASLRCVSSPVNSYIWLLLEKLLSHFAQLNGFSPDWVLSCVVKCPIGRRSCHTWYSWRAFLLCESSRVSLMSLSVRSSCHTLSNWIVFLRCVSSHVSSNGFFLRSSCYTLSNWKVFLLYESFHVSLSHLSLKSSCPTFNNWKAFRLCGSFRVSLNGVFLRSSCHTLSN